MTRPGGARGAAPPTHGGAGGEAAPPVAFPDREAFARVLNDGFRIDSPTTTSAPLPAAHGIETRFDLTFGQPRISAVRRHQVVGMPSEQGCPDRIRA
jgi:hypothetical protein